MRKKIRTMEELASTIGVSRPTLSKYFQSPASVRPSTRSKVEKALPRVDYVPNFFARNMNRKKTRLIGVVIPHLNDLFYTSMTAAIEQAASRRGYRVILQNSHGNRELELAALENLRSMQADGAIVAPIGHDSDADAFHRFGSELALVFADSQLSLEPSRFPFVGTDNRQSIHLLVDYLCRSGSPPKFLRMPKVNSNSHERAEAYVQRMRELGHTAQIIEPIGDETWEFEQYGYQRMKAMFDQGLCTDSTILCANDRLAIGVLRAANEHRLFGVGTGFRVAGHDDHPLAPFVWPTLTTAAQNTSEIGRTAFEMLIDGDAMNSDSGSTTHLLQARLTLRDSA